MLCDDGKVLLDARIHPAASQFLLLSENKSTFSEANVATATVTFKFMDKDCTTEKDFVLDVLVDNSGDSVITSVYRKPTW